MSLIDSNVGVVRLLKDGCEDLNLSLSELQIEKFLSFAQLLIKWNAVYNLTSLTTLEDIVTHHLLDSLSLVPVLEEQIEMHGNRVLDVGCGGGLPSIPCSIVLPNVQFLLVDAVAKKIAFNNQVIFQLGLKNVKALHQRIEKLNQGKFDIITSRAFASLEDFLHLTEPYLETKGVWLAMKGKMAEEEIRGIPEFVSLNEVRKISVPFLQEERHILQLSRLD